MPFLRKSRTTTSVSSGPAAAAAAVPAGLVSLVKTAAVSLEKGGLSGQRAAVYLVLDHSGSMSNHYKRGHVQRLAEQTLALSVNLDDDGVVPLVYFGTRAEAAIDVRLDNYADIVGSTHTDVSWGSTDYVAAMRAVINEHRASGATDPALAVFQTDGYPNDPAATERMLREASSLPIFWAFVGFGNDMAFLQRLDTLTGRRVDNAGFFHAADPRSVKDADLYDGITSGFAAWLPAARAAGIVR
jgi:hypothetical protein